MRIEASVCDSATLFSVGRSSEEPMDPADLRHPEEKDTQLNTIEGATMGLALGTIHGYLVRHRFDKPGVESSAALPRLIRTVKLMGTHGLTFAVMGGIFCGVQQLKEKFNMKIEFPNGSAAPFVAGVIVWSLKGLNISTASTIKGGSAIACIWAVLNSGRPTTKNDISYTVEKRPPAC